MDTTLIIIAAIELVAIAWLLASSRINRNLYRHWKEKYYIVRQDLDKVNEANRRRKERLNELVSELFTENESLSELFGEADGVLTDLSEELNENKS